MMEIIALKKWNKLTRFQRRLLVEFINGLLARQSKNSQDYGFDNSTYVNGTELIKKPSGTIHNKL